MSSTALAMDPTQASLDERSRDFLRIEKALERLAGHAERNLRLDDLAAAAGMSPFHFQRVFTRWAGVSPKQFMRHLGVTAAKSRLRDGANVLDAAMDAGFSGPSRLHDAFVRVEACTPGEYKAGLKGVTVHFGYHASPFGEALLMSTARGLCALGFVDDGARERVFDELAARFPEARFENDEAGTAALAERVFRARAATHRPEALRLYLHGTRFQIQVWRALLEIPSGALSSYEALATRIGNPRAVRAVGAANGANPIAVLIPCHRVIRKSGALGGYHWGLGRKLALIGAEARA